MIRCLVFIVLLGSCKELKGQALLQAKLTADSSSITETDSVTLSCQAPAHVSVYQCYFYVNVGTQTRFPCMKTFTGTELLSMRKQSSDPEVEVKCFYTVKSEALNSPSPHSDPSYINIGLKPQLSVNYLKGQFAAFSCSLPGSVKHDTTCNLYFGESSRPAATTTILKTKSSKTNQWFCFTEIQENELLNHLRSTKRNEVSCDYRLERNGESLSPRSDPYRFTGIAEVDLTEIITTPTSFTKTTGSSNVVWPNQESVTQRSVTIFTTGKEKHGTTKLTSIPSISTSTKSGDVEGESTKTEGSSDAVLSTQGATKTTKSETTSTSDLRTLIITAAVGGVIVVFILVVGACLIAKRGTGKGLSNRKKSNLKDQTMWVKTTDNTEMLPVDEDGVYSVITSGPAAHRPTGPGKSATGKPQTEDSDVYHVYCTIPDFPPPPAQGDGEYCLLQSHIFMEKKLIP
ncbi:location of vulva defective 1-like [Poeciliopsis prolifica]|uniref:location of vulva defective 1-like n=1 Tax=Poeciliopsis prolifica TaxID=188132 RepID=UPI0024135CAA|nr:location of vulva defective 1-like [Poeciliopsis prolifica]